MAAKRVARKQAAKDQVISSEDGTAKKKEHPDTEKLLARLRAEGMLIENPSNEFSSFAIIGYPSPSEQISEQTNPLHEKRRRNKPSRKRRKR